MSEERKHELVLGTHVKQMVAKVREIAPAATVPQVLKTARLAYEEITSAEHLAEHPQGGDVPLLMAVEALAARCQVTTEGLSPLQYAIGLQSLLRGNEKSIREAIADAVFGNEAAGPVHAGPAA